MAATTELSNQATMRAGKDESSKDERMSMTHLLDGVTEDDASSIKSKAENPAILTFSDLTVTAKARNQVRVPLVLAAVAGC